MIIFFIICIVILILKIREIYEFLILFILYSVFIIELSRTSSNENHKQSIREYKEIFHICAFMNLFFFFHTWYVKLLHKSTFKIFHILDVLSCKLNSAESKILHSRSGYNNITCDKSEIKMNAAHITVNTRIIKYFYFTITEAVFPYNFIHLHSNCSAIYLHKSIQFWLRIL